MKVVLIGDSIRMGYQPLVARKLEEAEVWGPGENCRHSLWALEHFEPWVAACKPDLVHVNFGIHDVTPMEDGDPQIVLPQYRRCLERFIRRVRALGDVGLIWATSTPLYAPEAGVPMAKWRRWADGEIDVYNDAACEIARREGVPVNDLHAVIVRNGFARCLTEDGCHITDFGNEVLSDAVVEAVRAHRR